MSRAVVTGCAGFIGSHLTEHLVETGFEVVGVDAFHDWYDPGPRRRWAAKAEQHPRFEMIEGDLTDIDPDELLNGVDILFHLAARPGVRTSWDQFEGYIQNNIRVTERLVKALVDRPDAKMVFASSSSIYGNAEDFPTSESASPSPISPYGVSKLACEHLISAYHGQMGVDARSLRYFTVYGPRQRPDMAFTRWIRAAVKGEQITLFGDGSAVRDFTYVRDIVAATVEAADAPAGSICNVSGGHATELNSVLDMIEQSVGRPLNVERSEMVPGDVTKTSGDSTLLRSLTGWAPTWDLAAGIAAQVDWVRSEL
jgi:UDP-glucuronate 4-epimerase